MLIELAVGWLWRWLWADIYIEYKCFFSPKNLGIHMNANEYNELRHSPWHMLL
jgi:hypothetical protein